MSEPSKANSYIQPRDFEYADDLLVSVPVRTTLEPADLLGASFKRVSYSGTATYQVISWSQAEGTYYADLIEWEPRRTLKSTAAV